MSEPIIQSRLDTDFYKFTMGQFVFHRYPNVQVKYAFKNRTSSVHLAEWIPENELREELDHLMHLPFLDDEIAYLRSVEIGGKRIFQEDYLEFLRNLKRLPQYTFEKKNGDYILEFPGPWSEAIYWETPGLGIKSELYYRNRLKPFPKPHRELIFEGGARRLLEKTKRIRRYPEAKIIEFGTRRRFERKWQDTGVVEKLKKELPTQQLLGTSNVYLARKHDLKPMGTVAHEEEMAIAGLMSDTDENLRASHGRVLREWEEEYSPNLLVALTDTFGSKFFFEDMTREQAEKWAGLRQDSGNPLVFGEAAIAFYQKHGVDPKTKSIVFSDGLDVDIIIKLHKAFRDRIKTIFGWGTNLTNDLGFKALSLVIKLTEANGKKTVKLSDNLAKATGTQEDIERYKRVFGHTSNFSEECKY